MKSYLIKDTTREERERIVSESVGQIEAACDGCAPGNAIITALEGKAIIGYEGKDHPLSAGESFRFDKNGLHSVTADGQFKMALLLVLE